MMHDWCQWLMMMIDGNDWWQWLMILIDDDNDWWQWLMMHDDNDWWYWLMPMIDDTDWWWLMAMIDDEWWHWLMTMIDDEWWYWLMIMIYTYLYSSLHVKLGHWFRIWTFFWQFNDLIYILLKHKNIGCSLPLIHAFLFAFHFFSYTFKSTIFQRKLSDCHFVSRYVTNKITTVHKEFGLNC